MHDHSKAYYEYIQKQEGKKTQIEREPRPDLFDFDNPQSDSDYDDMDEYTGIYHDDDPMSHPAQHVRHSYTEDQYYRSRERYFPEESYHAAGEMKYDVESLDALTAHALGKREPAKPAPAPPAIVS